MFSVLPVARLFVLFTAGAWLATACTSETTPDQPATEDSAPTAEDTAEASTNDGHDDCRQMQDMWDALPKLKTYRQFKLDETVCIPLKGVLSYKFKPADDKSRLLISVSLIDEKRNGDNTYTKLAQETYANASNPNGGVHKATLGIGESASVIGLADEVGSIGKYTCLFKGQYYFEIMVSQPDKSLTKPEGVESFVKDYLKQIDPGKLK